MKSAVAFAAVAAALGGGGWAVQKRFFAKPAQMESISFQAKEGPIVEMIDATGSVAPYHRVEIKPTISGRIEKLLVHEGDSVKQGQIVAWMSSADRAAILDAARAQGPDELRKWQDTYKPTPVIAPLPGLLILENVVEGQTVDMGTVLYAMSDVLIVIAQVDESDIGKLHVGMPARITLDSYPDRHELGKVFDILYEGKNVSNVIQYWVKIRPDKVPAYYRSQMTANLSFIVRKKENALLVPAVAVRDKDGAKQVLVPGASLDEKPAWREVKTGIENDSSVEIVAGLSPGDTVLVRQAKYAPQKAVSSPLTMGGRSPSSPSGQAPRKSPSGS